jgi:transposase-like protein
MTASPGDRPVEQAGSPAKPKRRVFSPEYKLKMVAEYDAAPEGTKRSLLRREGLYSSHLVEWRRARDNGALAAMTESKPGPAPRKSAAERENERLQRENAKLSKELKQQRAAVEALGKLSALLETLSESAEPDAPSIRSSPTRSIG